MPCYYFSVIQALGLLPAWISFSIASALNAQSIMMPVTIISVCNAALNVLLTWGFLYSGVGYLGVALAFTLSNWFGLFNLCMYVVCKGMQNNVWHAQSKPTLAISFATYVNTGAPSAASMWVEWWACEVLSIFAGWLPSRQYGVAANGILFNTLAIVYFTYVSTQVATSVRVGHLVGARDAARIPTAISAGIFISGLLSVIGSLVLQFCGESLVRMYTSHAQIVSEALSANLGIVLSVPPYAIMMCVLGAMRSVGLQAWGAWAVFFSFYMCGIPAGAYLAFIQGWGLLGIWMGNVVSLTLAALALVGKIYTVDWPKTVAAAMAYDDSAENRCSLSSKLLSPSGSPVPNLSPLGALFGAAV